MPQIDIKRVLRGKKALKPMKPKRGSLGTCFVIGGKGEPQASLLPRDIFPL